MGDDRHLRRRPMLSVQVPSRADDSFKASDTTFAAGHLLINRNGVYRDLSDEPESSPSVSSDKHIRDLDEVQILGTLGRGSTSVVHSAVHKSSGLKLAVKEINVFEKDQRRSLLKELHTLYEADSPYLVNFYGAFYKGGSIYIVLELMELGSLRDLLNAANSKSIKIPEYVLASLSNQIMMAFEYLHKKKRMVHRDIKPSNILLSREGRAKLTDFGVSTELGENAVATTFVGTCTYMSPERIMGLNYSYPSDVWSLGVILLECAMGRYPYPNAGVYIELMQAIVNGEVPRLPASDSSDEFLSFLDLCLQKAPEHRASVEDLINHPFIANVTNEIMSAGSKWILSLLSPACGLTLQS